MVIKTKYSVGDVVKVIEPNGNEMIIQINEIYIRINKDNILAEYYSDYYGKDKDILDFSTDKIISIHGTAIFDHEDVDCEGNPAPYIKCKVEIKEINN